MKYEIGQILTSTDDVEVTRISGEREIIPKGNKIIIGGDGLAHHLRDGSIQPMPDGAEISGYDCYGLAYYLTYQLKSHFPIEEFFEDYEITEEEWSSELEYFLYEIL